MGKPLVIIAMAIGLAACGKGDKKTIPQEEVAQQLRKGFSSMTPTDIQCPKGLKMGAKFDCTMVASDGNKVTVGVNTAGSHYKFGIKTIATKDGKTHTPEEYNKLVAAAASAPKTAGSSTADEIEKISKDACACADLGCASVELAKFKLFMSKNIKKKLARDGARRAGAAVKKLTTCLIGKGVAAKEVYAAMKPPSVDTDEPPSRPLPAATGKAATTEARSMLAKLVAGARTYYMDSGGGRGLTPIPAQFPSPSQGPTPPLGMCCKSADQACQPDAKRWINPVWVTLQFSIDDPHRYSYAYKVDGKKFTVRAYGDLDCDGVYSTFEMSGHAGGKSKIKVTNELE